MVIVRFTLWFADWWFGLFGCGFCWFGLWCVGGVCLRCIVWFPLGVEWCLAFGVLF